MLESFSIDDGYGSENVTLKKWANFLELIAWGPHWSLERERKIRRRLFMSSTKREIMHFHVVVVRRRQWNVQKSVMHVQMCGFD